MSETPTNTFRLITLAGIVFDFTSPNDLQTIWLLVKGEGFFRINDARGHTTKLIPIHAIAELGYHDPTAMLAQVPAASSAKN